MGTCVSKAGEGAVCVHGQASDEDAGLAKDGVTARFIPAKEYRASGNEQSAGRSLTPLSHGLTLTPESIFGIDG